MKALIIAICLSGCSAVPQPCLQTPTESLTETQLPLYEVGSSLEILNTHMEGMKDAQMCYVEYKDPCRRCTAYLRVLKK